MNWTYFFILFLSVVMGTVYRALKSLQHKSMWRGPQLDPHAEPPALPENCKHVRIETVIGTSHISAYMPANPDRLKKWVVFTHGIMHHCEQMLHLFDVMRETCNLVMWDYRGFGRSTGESDRAIAIYDLYALLHHIRLEHELDEVVLMGSSLGTNVVLHFLQTFKDRCTYVREIILCHPFYSLEQVFEHMGAPGTMAYILGRMDVRDVLPAWLRRDTNRRALVLGSSEDTITPWETIEDFNEQITCTDVGGTHFEFNSILFGEIHMWLAGAETSSPHQQLASQLY